MPGEKIGPLCMYSDIAWMRRNIKVYTVLDHILEVHIERLEWKLSPQQKWILCVILEFV